jgi:uncharacterized protein YegL
MSRVLPVYFAIDVSGSMAGQSLGSVERALLDFADELAASPILGDTVRVAIVKFSDHAELVLQLSDLTEVRSIPRLHASGATSLGALFILLERQIPADVRRLRLDGLNVFRPLVLLVTDGNPTDNWRNAYESFDLTAKANLIVIAHEEVDDRIIGEMRTLRTYRWAPWDGPGRMLAEVVIEVAQSLVRSTVVTDPGQTRLPARLVTPVDSSDEWV